MHIDGFAPGHFKVMLYPEKMNKQNGYFRFINKNIKSTTPLGIAFKNSLIFHQGVPGTKFNRFAIELTFMRTLFNCDDKKNHCYFGRHLKSPFNIYL